MALVHTKFKLEDNCEIQLKSIRVKFIVICVKAVSSLDKPDDPVTDIGERIATRVHCREDFRGCRAGETASEIPEIVYAFGPQLKAFMAVGILLKYFRRKLLQFE